LARIESYVPDRLVVRAAELAVEGDAASGAQVRAPAEIGADLL
jgi:hypothetical protein